MTRLALVLGLVLAVFTPAWAARAAQPSVTVDAGPVSIGQRVSVTVTGFPAGRAVSVSLCGNEARRGSVDCDLPGSVAFPISKFDDVHVTTFPIGTPPVPCPCVLKVTNAPSNDVAFAPIVIKAFPTAPIMDNESSEPLVLDVRVQRAGQNLFAWLRSFVGGPTPYDLRVTVRNRTSSPVDGVKVRARAGRSRTDQSRRVSLPVPSSLAGGQTWEHSSRVTLSAPVIGRFYWSVTAVGDGAFAHTSRRTRDQPIGLFVLGAALVGDLGWIITRKLRRRAAPSVVVPPPVLDLTVPPAVLDLRPVSAESLLARPLERDA